MAKTFVKRSEGSGGGEFRFIMVEAKQWQGDMGEIAQVIANLVRPAQQAQRLISAPARPDVGNGGDGGEISAEQPTDESETQPTEEIELTPRTSAKPRKNPIPKVLDLDLESGEVSWKDFATKKAPTSVLAKHLAVAYWFKTNRGIDGVTADHAYTCYRKAGWPTNIARFGQPFQDLTRARKGEIKDGIFRINQIGEDQVREMGAE